MQRTISAPRAPFTALVRTLTPPSRGHESLSHTAADTLAPAPTVRLQLSYADAVRLSLAPQSLGERAPRDFRDFRDSTEISIPKPHTQPYAHRNFMGLAGSMLRNATWSACLERCMPALFAQCVAPGVSITQVMRLLEGNPVLAAYGLWRGDNKTLPMEWDLWLDPQHPADLRRARVIHGNAVSTALAGSCEAREPGVAAAIMAGTRLGTDVHEGLTPLQWIGLFQAAAQIGGLPSKCNAVYLDVKSSWSSAQDLAGFVSALRDVQVETRGVLAFDFAQLASPLQVSDAVHLTHSPAGLAMALPQVPKGARAMFNGGALVDMRGPAPAIDWAQLNLVRALHREHGLRMGVYLQEDAVSPDALRVLITCINREAEAFTGGIAYGGLAGVAEGLIAHGGGTGCQTDKIALENASFFGLDAPG